MSGAVGLDTVPEIYYYETAVCRMPLKRVSFPPFNWIIIEILPGCQLKDTEFVYIQRD